MANDEFIPVWPGPVVMVPISTDILLVGTPDILSQTTWSSTKDNYINLWLHQLPDQPAPFGTAECPGVGAHLMWTLPYSLRHGEQAAQDNPDGTVNFDPVPNRWVVTRFTYPATEPNNTNPPPPGTGAYLVESDSFFDISQGDVSQPGLDGDPSQYPYPDDDNFPVRGIGVSIGLAAWDGRAGGNASFIKAVGPGDLSWSVAYDNVKNVFSFYDTLSDDAARYTYSIVGWYDNPKDDVLYTLPVDSDDDWRNTIETGYQWSVGDGVADVQDAVNAWLAWQQTHGLDGVFDPARINLPPQAKDAIIAWHAWQQAHGVTAVQPDLPIQSLYHSMASVLWQGSDHAYGTGVPKNKDGERLYPSVAIGNTSVEAISSYMAAKVVEEQHQSPEDVPVIERALEAFQLDLLGELESDPVKVETTIHSNRFGLSYSGHYWIVVRPESAKENILGTGGQQSIPLTEEQTRMLTALNEQQAQVNGLEGQIQSQREELFFLSIKKDYINRQTPSSIVDKVNQSFEAIKAVLRTNLDAYAVQKKAVQDAADAFQQELGSAYVLKDVELPAGATPNDPVIMVGGTYLDTKLSSPGQYDENAQLFVRFTGQAVTGIDVTYTIGGNTQTRTIGASELLSVVNMPRWNAIPKEMMDLWVEDLILDPSCARLIADLYFGAIGVTPTLDQLNQLTTQVAAQQTSIWNDASALGVHPQALASVSGIQGVIPSQVAVAFIQQQPWTPLYMDWRVIWCPSSTDIAAALNDWKLGDIDYEWIGNAINPGTGITLQGRTILNAKTAQIIQQKFASFENQSDYNTLPPYVIEDLEAVAGRIGRLDLLTQSMSGFTKQLATAWMSMNSYPDDKEVQALLGNADINYRPVLSGYDASAPFFPIRSGHLSVIDLWIVDAFGQVMRGKDPSLGASSPIPDIFWAESLATESPNYNGDKNSYGQLPPRLVQPSTVTLQLLKNDDDKVFTNSSDLTNPICGWVIPNHPDNSLMVFDAAGLHQGDILKVQREVTDAGNQLTQQYTIRWESAPGSTEALGALPHLSNDHLQSFVHELLLTGFEGAGAYEALISVIDVTLWTMSNFAAQAGNQSILLGRPLAVVRGELSLQLTGNPVYNESWIDTGKYYNNGGSYRPSNPPFMSVPLDARVGDAAIKGNGVMGYFQSDNYDTFYAVYGADGQTRDALALFSGTGRRAGAGPRGARLEGLKERIGQKNAFQSNYVQNGHLVPVTPDGAPVKLTMLVDPSGGMPVIIGSLPVFTASLPGGPVSAALNQLKASFRAGPLLLDPAKIKMPTPAEIHGNWDWAARRDVTGWNPDVPIGPYTPVATMEVENLRLIEGWMVLSNSEGQQ